MDKLIETELLTSLATIIMVILTLAIFIKYHASALFYVFVVISLVLGFLNAWLISTIEERSKSPLKAHKSRKSRRKS